MADPTRKTVGILHCGDLGAALATVLRDSNVRIVTCCDQRSTATVERAQTSGVECLPTIAEVAAQSEVVFSLVLPHAAVKCATDYIQNVDGRASDTVYVECNTVGLDKVRLVQTLFESANMPMVDAAIHGTAKRLADMGVLFVSGPQAGVVQDVLEGILPVDSLGPEVGSASKLKLMLAGVSKILSAMFLEISALAEQEGLWENFWENCLRFYPGTMHSLQRLLPTYPQHAERRAGEMRDLEQLAESIDLPAGMAREAAKTIERLARANDSELMAPPNEQVDLRTIVKAWAQGVDHEHAGTAPE